MEQFMGTLRTTQKKSMFVRALFNYDPNKDSGIPGQGLSFRHGDILHVTNASDDDWWQACKVQGDSTEQELGIIPSKNRIEKKDIARSRNVKFSSKDIESIKVFPSDNKSKSFFGKSKFFSSKKEKLIRTETAPPPSSKAVTNGKVAVPEKSTVLSYETVVQQNLTYTRPVIILGPLKDKIIDDLITEFPDRFACCVPHTTRPPLDGEVEGREYHFIRSKEEMERGLANQKYIEAGQYNGNMYGTSVDGIRAIAQSGRHCVLAVSCAAIQRLQDISLYPISILIRPRSIESVMEWHKRMSADQARASFELAVKIEREQSSRLTALVIGETAEEIYERVKDVISHQSTKYVWMSLDNNNKVCVLLLSTRQVISWEPADL